MSLTLMGTEVYEIEDLINMLGVHKNTAYRKVRKKRESTELIENVDFILLKGEDLRAFSKENGDKRVFLYDGANKLLFSKKGVEKLLSPELKVDYSKNVKSFVSGYGNDSTKFI